MLTIKKVFSAISGIYALPFALLSLIGAYAAFAAVSTGMTYPDTLFLRQSFFLPAPLVPIKFFAFLGVCAVYITFCWPVVLSILSFFIKEKQFVKKSIRKTIIWMAPIHIISIITVLLHFAFTTIGREFISILAVVFFVLTIINDMIWFLYIRNENSGESKWKTSGRK